MAHVRNHKCAILDAEVGVREERKDCNDLVLVSERGDQRTYGPTPAKVV